MRPEAPPQKRGRAIQRNIKLRQGVASADLSLGVVRLEMERRASKIAFAPGVLLATSAAIISGCGPQPMSDFERGQLMLQQQQLQLRQQQQAQEAVSRAAENAANIFNQKVPEYGIDPNQRNTNCVTGLDSLGRVVTQCQSN